jgi:hypothetical protein
MTRLSNRQYPMLHLFAQRRDVYMTASDAARYDQRPFRSMLIQRWIAYRPGHGFHITREGLEAWEEFRGTDIKRLNPNAPLTRFFDITRYEKASRAAS